MVQDSYTHDSTKIGIQASLELFKLLQRRRRLRRTESDIYRNVLDLLLIAATITLEWVERATVVTRSRTSESVRSEVQASQLRAPILLLFISLIYFSSCGVICCAQKL